MTSIALNPTESLHLVALDRPQLEAAHSKMIEWAKARLETIDVDADVETTNLDIAQKNGWLTTPFERRLNVINRQRTFYTKILTALEAGFAIVPNFAMNIFAIRTDAKTPRGTATTRTWARFVQSAKLLPAGEGKYLSPLPTVQRETNSVPDGKGGTTSETLAWPDEFTDVEFPIMMARPELMTRAGEAMAKKIFDEIGIAADAGVAIGGATRADPIILGRIRNPRQGRPALTFFIGWYFDPSRL
jgi:hypothetical protein